jgi:predicted ATP-dependent endonuclease of OLD family
MPRQKKIESPITLFAAIETTQHEALREIAFREHRSLADVVREALDHYISTQTQTKKRAGGKKR